MKKLQTSIKLKLIKEISFSRKMKNLEIITQSVNHWAKVILKML